MFSKRTGVKEIYLFCRIIIGKIYTVPGTVVSTFTYTILTH